MIELHPIYDGVMLPVQFLYLTGLERVIDTAC
jgi:hypothetical protein